MKKSTFHLINAGINAGVSVATYVVAYYGLNKILPKGTVSPRLRKWTIGAMASAAATANVVSAMKELDNYQAALDEESKEEFKKNLLTNDENKDYAFEARVRIDDAVRIFNSLNQDLAVMGNTINVIEKLEAKKKDLTIDERNALKSHYNDLKIVNAAMSKESLKLPVPMNVHYYNHESVYGARDLYKETRKYLRTIKNFLQLPDKIVNDTYKGKK